MPSTRTTSTRAGAAIVLAGILCLPVAAQDLVIHFDRPYNAAREGFDDTVAGFQEFMIDPDRLDAILERLERVRRRTTR